MPFPQLLAIALALIVVLITYISNLVPLVPLVFLGQSTIPISLGLLFWAAVAAGLLTSAIVRLLLAWQQPVRRQPPAAPAQFSYPPTPDPDDDWIADQPEPEPPERFPAAAPFVPDRLPPEPSDSEPPSDYVYDADYRVISPPPTSGSGAPVVGSKLSPESEDWGFDFDDEEQPKR